MVIRAFVGGPTHTVGYLVFDHDGGAGAIVDTPLGSARRFLEAIEARKLTIAYIINTHGHWDHIADNAALQQATGAELCAHWWDATRMWHPELTMEEGTKLAIVPSKPDVSLQDGSIIEVGSVQLEVMHTPGHSPGSICLYSESAGVLFSGDILRRMRIGTTAMPGGNQEHMTKSLQRLALLPDKTIVYPGRGVPTTIRDERWLLELAGEASKA